jgi:proteic killer suppression protein
VAEQALIRFAVRMRDSHLVFAGSVQSVTEAGSGTCAIVHSADLRAPAVGRFARPVRAPSCNTRERENEAIRRPVSQVAGEAFRIDFHERSEANRNGLFVGRRRPGTRDVVQNRVGHGPGGKLVDTPENNLAGGLLVRPGQPLTDASVEARSLVAALPKVASDRANSCWSLLRQPMMESRIDTRYNQPLIEMIRHRGLKRLYERGDASKLRADQVKRIEDVLAHLDMAAKPSDVHLPGYRLHRLKGDLKDACCVSISGNWRVIFRFDSGHAFDVDLVDYH